MAFDFGLGLSLSRLARRGAAIGSALPPLTIDGNTDGVADGWALSIANNVDTPFTSAVSGSGETLSLASSSAAGSATLQATVAAANMSRAQFRATVTALQTGTLAQFRLRIEWLGAGSVLLGTSTSSLRTASTAAAVYSLSTFRAPFGTVSARLSVIVEVPGAGTTGSITFTGATLTWQK